MNGRPNGIGGRAEGSGGRYGWLRYACQLDLSYMRARTQASKAKKEVCIPRAHTARPRKIYLTMGTSIHIRFSFSSPFLSLQATPHATFSAFTPPRSLSFYVCTPATLQPRTHLRTSSKLISSKPPSWQVADAGHARHDAGDGGGHWHAHTHRHAHCAHGVAGHHRVEHHRVEHLVRDGRWANADEWWWSRE